VSTGQSLSVGGQAPVVSTTQPYNNVRLFDSLGIFSGYVLSAPLAPTLSLQPLICPPQAYDSVDGATGFYPRNIGGPGNVAGETLDVRLANQITANAKARGLADYVIASGAVGASGQPMAAIQKNTNGNANSYAASTYFIQAVANLAKVAGKTFGCGAIHLTHGESDALVQTPNYGALVLGLRNDYNTDIRKLTGQNRQIPLILNQMTSNPASGQGPNGIATQQMLVCQQNRGLVVGACTKYAYQYADGQHMNDNGYWALGEKHAQVYDVIDRDGLWEPCWPVAIVRSGTTVTVYIHVPVGPLVIDGGHTGPHLSGGLSSWGPGVGFEAYDAVQTVTGGTGNGVSPIVLTVASTANYTTGQTVYSNANAGNTNANGAFVCTVVDGTHISLNGTTGNGTWTTNSFWGSPYIANVIGVGAPTLAQVTPNLWTATFTLSRTPTTGLQVGYANTPDSAFGTLTGGFSNAPAFPSGRCGLIRDSDPFTGISGLANQNWLWAFTLPVS
jgi:hypothetical protein